MARKVAIADRFVHSSQDVWGRRRAQALGFVVHMAEGTNVWRYLSGGNVSRGVSVHFTVEENGEIVQMLDLSTVSGSINPTTIRRDDDDNGHFGWSHNKYVLKDWALNPNHAVITVEVAGRGKDGPNDRQVRSLDRLFQFLREKYPRIKPLGHRDFQKVKPCPGQKMWHKGYTPMGGHGKDFKSNGGGSKDQMIIIGDNVTRDSSHFVKLPEGVKVYETPGGDVLMKTRGFGSRNYEFYGRTSGYWAIEILAPSGEFSDGQRRRVIAYIKKDDWTVTQRKVDTEVPQPEEQQERVDELESALGDIASANKTLVIVGSAISDSLRVLDDPEMPL